MPNWPHVIIARLGLLFKENSLKIEQSTLDDHQVKLRVEIENDTYEGARKKAARQIAKRIKVPGFRPGKAPFNVIEKQVGSGAIEEEAIDIILDEIYPKVLEESGIEPYGPGNLEKVDDDKDKRIFEFRVPLTPEVMLGKYAKIRIPFKQKKVTKKDIDGVVESLRDQQAVLEPVDRAVLEGDMAYVLLSGEREKADDEGNTALIKERTYPVVIEKENVKDSNEWPFPGFSRNLIGLKVDDTKEFKHTFGKDSEFEDLKGENAAFKVKLEEIKDRILPEINDEFAKSLGEYEDVKSLTEEIKGTLKQNFERQQEDEYENSIVEKIVEMSEVKFPPQMLDHEMEHYIKDMGPQLAQQGLTMENYLTSRKMDMEALMEEVRPTVEERMKKSLVINEIARQEKIEVSEEEIQILVSEKVTQLQQMMSPEDAKKSLSGDALQGLVSRTMTEEIINRTLTRLRNIAKGDGDKESKDKLEKTKGESDKTKKKDSPKASTKMNTPKKDKKDEGEK